MRTPHYIVKRARSGRFNFTLLSDHGRINGSVTVSVEKHHSRSEIEDAAHREIRALVGQLADAALASKDEG